MILFYQLTLSLGETTLSVLLARGHYLPANDHILKSFTEADVEE